MTGRDDTQARTVPRTDDPFVARVVAVLAVLALAALGHTLADASSGAPPQVHSATPGGAR